MRTSTVLECTSDRAAIFWDSLHSGYAGAYGGKKKAVVIRVYGDASSGQGKKKLFLLAAFVATCEKWKRFSDQWQSALSAKPAIKHFHMVEAKKLEGEFAGFSKPQRDKKVLSLANVCRTSQLVRLSCSAYREDVSGIVGPIAQIPRLLKYPYVVCFYSLVGLLANREAMELGVPIDFIFDEEGRMGRIIEESWPFIKKKLHPSQAALLCNPPLFRDDKLVLPLQACDLLAWHLRRNREHPKEQYAALDILRTLPGQNIRCNTRNLKATLRAIGYL